MQLQIYKQFDLGILLAGTNSKEIQIMQSFIKTVFNIKKLEPT